MDHPAPEQLWTVPADPLARSANLLDWHDRSHWSSRQASCTWCRRPTHLRDDQGEPRHKVCAEAAAFGVSQDGLVGEWTRCQRCQRVTTDYVIVYTSEDGKTWDPTSGKLLCRWCMDGVEPRD